jgi:precorrin-6B methylase 1
MAVVGVGLSEGEFTSGESVEVVREGAVILSSEASLEFHVGPGMVAFVLPAVDADVRPGDEARALTNA